MDLTEFKTEELSLLNKRVWLLHTNFSNYNHTLKMLM